MLCSYKLRGKEKANSLPGYISVSELFLKNQINEAGFKLLT